MDVGKTTRARLTAPAKRPGELLGVGKRREWEQLSFSLAWVDCFDGISCCIHFGGFFGLALQNGEVWLRMVIPCITDLLINPIGASAFQPRFGVSVRRASSSWTPGSSNCHQQRLEWWLAPFWGCEEDASGLLWGREIRLWTRRC